MNAMPETSTESLDGKALTTMADALREANERAV